MELPHPPRAPALQSLTSACDRREVPVVLVLAGAFFLDAAIEGEGTVGLLAVLAVALTTAPLLWRRATPVLALAVTVAGVFACLATLRPYEVILLPVLLCAYSVAAASDRLRSAITGACLVAASVVAVAPEVSEKGAWKDLIVNAMAIVIAIVVGDAVRTRRAVRAATALREEERERNRQEESLRMVAEERLRIAQDVHDVVAHAMVAISVQAGVAAHVLERRPEEARTALVAIKGAADVALRDLAGTLGVLREGEAVPLRPTGSLEGLDELAVPLRGAGVEVSLDVAGPVERVPAPVGAAVFRIVQEAATNVLRHAGTTRASIRVEVAASSVEVTVEDDGSGRPRATTQLEPGSGNGVRGMTERATTLGGRLEAGRRPGGGWRVHAVLPL